MSLNKEQFSSEVKRWNAQLESARKREKNFRKEGCRITAIYEAEKKEEFQFNILYSNTETLAPALYNNVPRPVVDRRFKDKDPLGRMASMTTKRALEYLIDSNDQDYSNFDDMMKSAVLEALVPGRGLTRFKYHPSYGAPIPAEEGEEGGEELREVEAETVCGEEVPWNRVLMGYGKTWKDVPWLAFEHFFSKAEAEEAFGKETAAKIPYTISGGSEDGDEENGEEKIPDADGEKFSHVFEIWEKRSKKVLFIAAGFGEVVKTVEDPLKLSGFFPCPRPLAFMSKISCMTPKSLYAMYEEQAKELNAVTIRINKLTHALKVRGFYDATLTGLDELMKKGDNELMPAQNVSAMLQGQTLEKAIWFFPLEKLINVLQQLYVNRESCKQVIYEITGISDILRGSSVASETATAQNIKNQWGTLRLKKMQKEVMRYVRDCLRLMGEIAVTKLSEETIAAMTGLPFPTAQQKQQAQMAAQMATQQAQMTGQPPQIPPELQKVLAMPSWADIMGLLRNDLQRNYRIDIETNSTVDAEATEDKTDIAEFMNAMSQFMNGMMPVIEQGIMSFDVAKGMLLSIVKRFRFGTEVEDQINEMQAPPPKQPGEDPKMAAEKAKADAAIQQIQAEAQATQMKMKADAELQAAELAMKREQMAAEAELAAMQADIRRNEMRQQQQLAQLEHELRLEEIEMKREEMAMKKAAALRAQVEGTKEKENA